MKKTLKCLSSVALVGAVAFHATPAAACGGCFVPATESTVVTGHRMALSISTTQTVLWDQIQYAGNPEDFSWVLPVKPGTVVEASNDAFFEALEAATGVAVSAPPEGCAFDSGGGIGCGASEFGAPNVAGVDSSSGGGVQVVHQGSVGPYETVTLSATNPDALTNWLIENDYDLPDAIKPTVDAYVSEGFDFIALKLSPGKDVQQMTPVRIVTEGAGYSLPLRMVAAGAGANVDLVLYLIGEGRHEAANFDNIVVAPELVSWDFKVDASDYAKVRLGLMNSGEQTRWLTSYARRGSLLAPVDDPIGFGGQASYNTSAGFANTIADAYFLQHSGNVFEPEIANCAGALGGYAFSMDVVTDLCDEDGENCAQPAAGQLPARELACGGLDDIAVALTGMHPADVHLTRLEARLPRTALDVDLKLQAADDQSEVFNRFVAGVKLNACWDSSRAAVLGDGNSSGGDKAPPLPPGGVVLLVLGAAAILLVSRRADPRRVSALS